MAGDLPEVLLANVDESRRSFLRKLIVSTAFVTPTVASFTMGGLGIGEAVANVSNLSCFASNLGPHSPVSWDDLGNVQGSYDHFDYSGRDNLCDLNLIGSSFVGTDFAGSNLRNSMFGCDNCAEANFSGANLQGVSFVEANLSGANFAGANLSGADFTFANVTGANFAGATVSGTIFRGTNLRNANFVNTYGKPSNGT